MWYTRCTRDFNQVLIVIVCVYSEWHVCTHSSFGFGEFVKWQSFVNECTAKVIKQNFCTRTGRFDEAPRSHIHPCNKLQVNYCEPSVQDKVVWFFVFDFVQSKSSNKSKRRRNVLSRVPWEKVRFCSLFQIDKSCVRKRIDHGRS